MSRKPTTADRDGCERGTCKHDGTRWTASCAKHEAADAALAIQWHEDYYRTVRPDPERVRFATGLGNAEGLL